MFTNYRLSKRPKRKGIRRTAAKTEEVTKADLARRGLSVQTGAPCRIHTRAEPSSLFLFVCE
jgi:hypothetical protein